MKAEIGFRVFTRKRKPEEEVLDLDIILDNSSEGNRFFEKILYTGKNKMLGLRLRIMSEGNCQYYAETIVDLKKFDRIPYQQR